jgi:hypothetical protein
MWFSSLQNFLYSCSVEEYTQQYTNVGHTRAMQRNKPEHNHYFTCTEITRATWQILVFNTSDL